MLQRHIQGTLEGRTIEYRPGGGLDYHNSPLMAEIPEGEYRNIHRSIDQLRSMNERGVLGPLGFSATDIRASLVHDYKQFNISDLRNNERLVDYVPKNNAIDIRGDGSTANNNNNNQTDDLRHGNGGGDQHPEQKPYSSPSTPPTPISIADGQMAETKVGINLSFNFIMFNSISNYLLLIILVNVYMFHNKMTYLNNFFFHFYSVTSLRND